MKVPILVLAFNRADHVVKAMEAIREYKPERLYLECDGARPHKSGEAEAVELTRKTMLEMVDWQCEVKTLFREKNLGCANAVYGAITWFFEHEEWGVIIEDDVVVGQDFFRLCEELLPRYAKEEKVMEISAENHYPNPNDASTYFYSVDFKCWGWASWARAWKRMDMKMTKWPKQSLRKLIRDFDVFKGCMMYYYWSRTYKNIAHSTSWATRWAFTIYAENGLCIIPGVNLAVNIGTDGGAHYENGDVNPYSHLRVERMSFPLVYNDVIELDDRQRRLSNKDFFRIRMIGLRKKLRTIGI